MLKPPVCRKQLRAASPPAAFVLIHSALFPLRSEQYFHCSLDRVQPGKKKFHFFKIVFYLKN